MAKYKEKLAEVEAVQFEAPKPDKVKHDTRFTLSDKESLPVGNDAKSVHSSLAGKRIENGDWVVTHTGGFREVLTDTEFHSKYEVTSTKK